MQTYGWAHVEGELRPLTQTGVTALSTTVTIPNPVLGINVVHRIGAGNYLRDIPKFGNWDSYAEHIYEF